MKDKPIKSENESPSGKVPLCERTDLTNEEKNKLVTVDDLYARGSGNLYDSIWAPGNEKLAAAKMAARRAASTHVKREPLSTTKAINQPSSIAKPDAGLNFGIGASRFSSNVTQMHSTLPVAVAPVPVLSSQLPVVSRARTVGQPSSNVPPHNRGPNPDSQNSLPPHLRGMSKQTPVTGRVNNQQLNGHGSNTGGFEGVNTGPSAKVALPEPDRGSDQTLGASSTEKQQSAMSLAQEPQKTTSASAEDTFMAYMKKKAAAAADAKKAAKPKLLQQMANTTPLIRAPVASTSTWGQPSVARVGGLRHSHFRVDVESQGIDSFQDFLKKKQTVVTNGKRYTVAATHDTAVQESTNPGIFKSLQPAPLFKLGAHAGFHPDDLPNDEKVVNTALRGADIKIVLDNVTTASQILLGSQEKIIPCHNGPVQSQNLQAVQDLVPSFGFARLAMTDSSGGWEIPCFWKHTIMDESMLLETSAVNGPDEDTDPLTEEAMLAAWGVIPRQLDSSNTFKVSDDGIGAEEKEKENVRGTQGRDATEELLDWDKTWLPPPCVWEDRGTFDTGFIPDYIRKDWQPNLVVGPVQFDLSTPDFKFGRSAVNNLKLDAPLVHIDTIPAIEEQENESKRMNQTSEIEAMAFFKRREKMNRFSKKLELQATSYKREFELFEPPPNPFAPTIEIYLRPATVNDLAGITEIYNFYVQNSMITEDQAPVEVADFKRTVAYCSSDKLPFIVAVKGSLPPEPVSGPRKARVTAVFPTNETVVGFALAQAFNVGFGGSRSGRSRTTADVQLYVHSDYTRKGVGRCLLDRIAQCLSFAYGAKDGYPWINPGDEQVYKAGGSEYWHQLVIQLPVKANEDPPAWLTNFLRKFWFMEDGRLQSVGRTPAHSCLSEFMDVMLFSHLATAASEFPTTV